MRAIRPSAVTRSALDDAEGSESRHAQGDPEAVDHLHHVFDVLVRLRHLLGEGVPARGARDDAARAQLDVDAARFGAEHPRADVAGPVGQELAVREREVRGGAHGAEIVARLGGIGRGARELAIGHADAIAAQGLARHLEVVGAHLVAKAARPRVDHHHRLPGADAEGLGGVRVVDLVHHLHLEEMIPRAEGAELAAASSGVFRRRTPQLMSNPIAPGLITPRSASVATTPPTGRPYPWWMSGIASAALTIPGRVAPLAICSSEASLRMEVSRRSSATTRPGTRIPRPASRGIRQR